MDPHLDHAVSLNRLPSLAGSSCNVRVGAWDRLPKIGEWQIDDNSRVFQGKGVNKYLLPHFTYGQHSFRMSGLCDSHRFVRLTTLPQ
jgi:hypothetical protein